MLQVIVKPVAAYTLQVIGGMVVGGCVAGLSALAYNAAERKIKKIRFFRHQELLETICSVIDREVEAGQLSRPTPTPV
jgi:hypothetical protein